MTTESLPEAADAEHLTETLRRAGALGEGRVCNVVAESSRLRTAYSEKTVPEGLPQERKLDWVSECHLRARVHAAALDLAAHNASMLLTAIKAAGAHCPSHRTRYDADATSAF